MRAEKFWSVMEDLRSTSSRNSKKRTVKEVYREQDATDVYWAFRLLVGNPLENPDMNLGVAKKTVRKAGERAFNVPYDRIRDREKELGNLSEVFREVEYQPGLAGDEAEQESMSINRVGEGVLNVATNDGENAKIREIADLLRKAENPQVVSFALLDDIALGVSSKTLLQALAEETDYSRSELDRAHGINPDVGRIAHGLKKGKGLKTELEPFARFKPMLASSKDIPQETSEWYGNIKYDGARVLIHQNVRVGPSAPRSPKADTYTELRVFTRNRNEVTTNLPEIQEIDWPNVPFIVDGEAVAYDPETDEPLPFQKIMERFQREKGIEAKREEVEVRVKLFDLPYWKGKDLTDIPYRERLAKLEGAFSDELLAEVDTDLEAIYQRALEQGHEGIIAKDVHSKYKFSRDSAWRKHKPVKEPIDLRVRGVVRGTGRMSDTLGALKLETQDGVYVGRVGTGFSDRDRDELWAMHQDDGLEGEVVEVQFEELQKNGSKYGLRFPRYERLRPEGEPDTLERIKEL